MGCLLIECLSSSDAIGDTYVLALQKACLTRHAFDKYAPSLAAKLLHPAAKYRQ